MELLFDSYPFESRRFGLTQDNLIKALQTRTYMDLVLANVERLYYYISGDAAEILCFIALRCL